jgi:hypothetical protein
MLMPLGHNVSACVTTRRRVSSSILLLDEDKCEGFAGKILSINVSTKCLTNLHDAWTLLHDHRKKVNSEIRKGQTERERERTVSGRSTKAKCLAG